MTSELDTIHGTRLENSRDYLRKAYALIDEAQFLSEEQMRAIAQNLGKKVDGRPKTVDYITKYDPATFSSRNIYDMTKNVKKQDLMTYSQSVRILDVVYQCVGSVRMEAFMMIRNTFKDFIMKYRRGTSPRRDDMGRPMLSMSEIMAASMICRDRVMRRTPENVHDDIDNFLDNYEYVIDSFMGN